MTSLPATFWMYFACVINGKVFGKECLDVIFFPRYALKHQFYETIAPKHLKIFKMPFLVVGQRF